MEKENLIVIIPAYEPPKEFVTYAKTVSAFAKELVVVNDGSGKEFEQIFTEISSLPNVKYISYQQNGGKGFALKQAFRYCLENHCDDDIIVTADCDGQHSTEDIFKVFRAASVRSDALILGSRDFNLPNVPKRSKSGNAQMRRMFRLFYGLNIYDTQTGLRGFSVSLAKRYLEIKGDRFEYEMGMLIYSQKNDIPIAEVPIQTIYPENAAEHVSHFKTFSDSLRMLGVVLGNLNWYLLSSALSGILDIAVFFILSSVVLGELSAVNTLIAAVGARVASSLLNFSLNYKYVFEGKSKRSMLRYYILWFCQLGASYGLVFLFGNIIGWNLTVMKVIGDLILGFFSYQIQRLWVFKHEGQNVFYGAFVGVIRQIARAFSKRYRSNVMPRNEGVVYVCRHLNMHGPYTSLKWLNFHVHPMVLSPFFDYKECYRQFADYTFTERAGKKKKSFNLKAFLSSRFVPPAVKSLKAVPVYRQSVALIKTFRSSVEYLQKNESLIIYPDIDYTADRDNPSEIYDGFLYLGELYKRVTGNSLKFIPLYIDEEHKKIIEFDYITIDNFRNDKKDVAEYLKRAINGKGVHENEQFDKNSY